MAYIEPNSTIMLFKTIPFDIGYNDTMYFPNERAQSYWFSDIVDRNRIYSNISYQRNGRGSIKLEEDIANVYDCNYMAFKNTSFENKWFYAFVTNVEYINNATVRIDYVLDVIQTWIIQAQFNECFIERQHSVTDNYAENLQPEAHDTGPMVYYEKEPLVFTPAIVLVTTIDLDDPNLLIKLPCVPVNGYDGDSTNNPNGQNSGMISGCFYKMYPYDAQGITALTATLTAINILQWKENVVCLFVCAKELWEAQQDYTKTLARPTKNGNYTPRNNKLLVYPFHSISVSTGDGNETLFQQEFFNYLDWQGSVLFQAWQNKNPLSTVALIPKKYKGKDINYDAIIETHTCPQCTWNNDEYWAWLAQNLTGVTRKIMSSPYEADSAYSRNDKSKYAHAADILNVANNGGADVATLGAGLATGEAAIAAVDALVIKPIMSTNNFNGNVNDGFRYQLHGFRFDFANKDLTPEYAARIDKYFDMFGYAQNVSGIPNLHARPKYTYVKTVNCSVGGNIPSSAARAIEHIMNRGIRFWDSGAVFGSFDPAVNNNSPSSP